MATVAGHRGPRAGPRRSLPLRIATGTGIGVGILLLLLLALVGSINTGPGRRFVADQINGLEMASGLKIGIERIDGSLYGKLRIHGLTLSDPKGVFLSAPLVELDWRPFAYISNHVDIRSATIPEARLRRLPALRPGADPNAPILPDIDLDIGLLRIGRMQVDPAVTGQKHLLWATGRIAVADRRAQIKARIAALRGPGIAGGDRLELLLDAVPDENKLDVAAHVEAPAGGFVTSLVGLNQPLEARIRGRGEWKAWSGRFDAALGGTAVAALAITASDGRFTVNGPLRPNILVTGPARGLVSPLVRLNLTTTLDQRRAGTHLRLRSPALAVAADGLIDLGQNRFSDFKVAVRLLQARAIAPHLTGDDVLLALVLNDRFATPRIAYRLQATRLGFNTTIVERLHAQGAARVDADRILIPIAATAARVSGLNPAVGGLLTNVRIDGQLAISGLTILSDNLRIRSDRMNATAIIVADIAKGQYRGAIQGRVENYLVQGFGLLDVTTNMDVVRRKDGFAITGRVAIRTRRIDNSTVRDLFGGNATITANLAVEPSGLIRFDALRIKSPGLAIASGAGFYAPDGRVSLDARGVSRSYGPLALAVRGKATSPEIRLRAARPGLGIGLADVDALIRGTAAGWAVRATGTSSYGPFAADLTILSHRGPLTLDLRRLTIAGFTFAGRVVQSPAGPFTGALAMSGSGLTGTVRLAVAEGRYQQAEVDATANGAKIPGTTPILVQRGTVRATAILYPSGPAITGDVQAAGVRSGTLLVQAARARISYRGSAGTVQLVARGSSGGPFRVAVNAQLTPTLIRAAATGELNGIAFRTARAAELHKVGDAWQLTPTTIALSKGNIRLAGRFGNGSQLQARLDGVDVAMLNAFVPGLGLDGTANGSVDFVQPAGGGMPRAEARITIDDFTRTGITSRSTPVRIALVGRLGPEGGATAAVIRRGSAIVGRLQARLEPLGPGGSWTERLLASPLAGGIRYNGPAEVLWSLTGIGNQQVSGPVAVAADFTGRAGNPQLVGVIRANALNYENETYGTRLNRIALTGRFTSSRLEISQLSGRAGDGSFTGQGSIGLAAAGGFPIDLRFTFDRARLARGEALGATVSGTIAITNSASAGALISGDLRLPEVRYQIVRQGSAEVAELEGVRRKGEEPAAETETGGASVPSIWKLDLRIRADNQVYVSGMGLESEWRTDLQVRGTSSSPIITGTAEVIRGTYSFGGRRFDLDEGDIRFTGSQPIDPLINMSANTTVENVTATLNVTGTAKTPRIALTSSPSLPQDEILARIFFGSSVTQLSAIQAVQLAASLNSLRGSGGGLNPLGKLRSASGLDRLRIVGADKATGRGTAIAAGTHISNDIYIEIITDTRGFTATQLEVALSKTLSVLSQASTFGTSSLSIRYSKDY